MSSILVPSQLESGVKYRQITAHLRALIHKGKLKPGIRLPTARALAKQWGTNHFTIQLALTPLVNEGLIERSPRRGTFVRDRKAQIASIAIYYGGNLWTHGHGFYQRAYESLEKLYQERRIQSALFVDDRADKSKPLPELQKAIDLREVQGVIALMLVPPITEWLRKMHVPVSMFGSGGLHPDLLESFEKVMARFAADGCKTVGMIYPRLEQDWFTAFKNLANRHGLKTDPRWLKGLHDYNGSPEFAGYNLFKDIWSGTNHPDAVFVYPDVVCRGAVVAILELGLHVPRDLKVIFHRNNGIDYLCPWKIPYLVTDIEEVAHLLTDRLDAQFRGDAMLSPTISSKLIDTQKMTGR